MMVKCGSRRRGNYPQIGFSIFIFFHNVFVHLYENNLELNIPSMKFGRFILTHTHIFVHSIRNAQNGVRGFRTFCRSAQDRRPGAWDCRPVQRAFQPNSLYCFIVNYKYRMAKCDGTDIDTPTPLQSFNGFVPCGGNTHISDLQDDFSTLSHCNV